MALPQPKLIPGNKELMQVQKTKKKTFTTSPDQRADAICSEQGASITNKMQNSTYNDVQRKLGFNLNI